MLRAMEISQALKLRGCYVISLRPAGDHAALRRAAAKFGAKVLALSPWKLVPRLDADSAQALRTALRAPVIVVTSPAAVRAAEALHGLQSARNQHWCAVGEGTAKVLRRAGVAHPHVPTRMDSEGLLALAVLRNVKDQQIGIVTAPGGRDRIAPALRERGARVLRADIYDRVPMALSRHSLHALHALRPPFWLALSSGEALQHLMAQLDTCAQAHLLQAHVAVASERLAALAQTQGFDAKRITQAHSARPQALLAAMATAAGEA